MKIFKEVIRLAKKNKIEGSVKMEQLSMILECNWSKKIDVYKRCQWITPSVRFLAVDVSAIGEKYEKHRKEIRFYN